MSIFYKRNIHYQWKKKYSYTLKKNFINGLYDRNIWWTGDLIKRTNNAVESFNSMFNRIVRIPHPSLHTLIPKINKVIEDIDKVVEYLCKYGLDAIETRHSKHSEYDYNEFSLIAKKYNLKETEGSDYHGPNVKPTVKLGGCVKEK